MPEQPMDPRPHFVLTGTAKPEHFRSTRSPRSKSPPNLDRPAHGRTLLAQLTDLKAWTEQITEAQRRAGIDAGFGIQVEFKSQPDVEMAFESLSRDRQGIELLNVRHEGAITYATVYIPEGKLETFEKIVGDYLAEKRSKNGKKSLDHKALIDTIQEIRAATFDALWTDDISVLPSDENQPIWWEIWLPIGGNRQATLTRFRNIATGIGFELSTKVIEFPERTVLHMRGSKLKITQSMLLLNNVAEIRCAKETSDFFDSLSPIEQRDWVEDLLTRTTFAKGDVPHVCLLDTGVNSAHPLLAPSVDNADLHTINPAWGSHDTDGHGTQMAGLALFGDLTDLLVSPSLFPINHRLESVKILSRRHAIQNEPFGKLTIEAVARPEVSAPHRKRVFSMAVTAKDSRDRGKPSAWSATLDSLACDTLGEGQTPRLLIVSAGNVEQNFWRSYPDSNITDGIHDPGQSWNAITVGAYTEKNNITEPDAQGFQPTASAGSLSPFSTTSLTWHDTRWPYKPDVVFEGGNTAQDDSPPPLVFPSLSLLTTHHQHIDRLFVTSNATSAASALCSRMVAQIMAQYPNLWSETVRALIVHSAEWTPQMLNDFLDPRRRKEDYAKLIRHVGYGVPILDSALWSLSNSLTLIVQESLQPFQREGSKEPTSRDMNLHRLLWPQKALQELGESPVEMRVTLSYFIEPNPGVLERGIKGRYRYESHGLRFEVKRPEETEDSFRMRINRRARDEEEESYQGGGKDPNWQLGADRRHLGSIHSDTWKGTAAALAERGILAVYPTLGWWKTAKKLERYNNRARYALLVTIKAPEAKVDLYNILEQTITHSVSIES